MRRDLAAVIAGSAVVAAQFTGRRNSPTPDHPRTAAWYKSLIKPSVTPPGPVFAVVWTVLDALLAFSGYRLLSAPRSRARAIALALWGSNLVGVGGFSWVLFGRKQLGEATLVTAGMVGTAVGSVVATSFVDREASAAGVPLAVWVSFAMVLQEEVWRRNARSGFAPVAT